jgi:hypothetical protein
VPLLCSALRATVSSLQRGESEEIPALILTFLAALNVAGPWGRRRRRRSSAGGAGEEEEAGVAGAARRGLAAAAAAADRRRAAAVAPLMREMKVRFSGAREGPRLAGRSRRRDGWEFGVGGWLDCGGVLLTACEN